VSSSVLLDFQGFIAAVLHPFALAAGALLLAMLLIAVGASLVWNIFSN